MLHFVLEPKCIIPPYGIFRERLEAKDIKEEQANADHRERIRRARKEFKSGPKRGDVYWQEGMDSATIAKANKIRDQLLMLNVDKLLWDIAGFWKGGYVKEWGDVDGKCFSIGLIYDYPAVYHYAETSSRSTSMGEFVTDVLYEAHRKGKKIISLGVCLDSGHGDLWAGARGYFNSPGEEADLVYKSRGELDNFFKYSERSISIGKIGTPEITSTLENVLAKMAIKYRGYAQHKPPLQFR